MDLSELQALLAQFQPSEDDARRAQMQGLAAAGFGLMGARKGQELQALGNAGLLGLQARDQAMAGFGDSRMKAMQQAQAGLGLQEHLQKYNDAKLDTQFLQGYRAPTLPNMAPTNANAQAMTSQQSDYYGILMDKANQAENAGRSVLAANLRAQAEKYAPQYEGTETVMKGDKPVLLQKYKNRAPTELAGYDPKPDFAEVDLGGEKRFVNRLTIPQSGSSFAKTMTPEGASSREIGLGNLGVARAHLAISQAAERRAAAGGGTKPQWDSASGQFVIAPNEQNPTGLAVSPVGFNKAEQKPSDQQLSARGFLSRMDGASQIINGLEDNGYSPGFGAAVVKGAKALPLIGGVAGGIVGAAGNAVEGGAPQKYEQAQRDWVRAKLRKESGAVIGKEEEADEVRTYFPQPGDSAEVIAQKRASRYAAEKQMAIQGGLDRERRKAPSRQSSGEIRSLADQILAGG